MIGFPSDSFAGEPAGKTNQEIAEWY